MQLIDIRNEVLAKGFDPNLFGLARVNAFINEGYALICRRVDYYVDESSQAFQTATGVQDLTLPANWARTRSLLDTDREVQLQEVGLLDIDRAPITSGAPNCYAQDGRSLRLFPTPDATYDLLLRYWLIPTPLAADTDTPTLPSDWHHLLYRYATAECYKSEDDFTTGAQWEQDFEKRLAMFEADQRFPSTDAPTQIKSMWGEESLSAGGWHRSDGF